MRRWARRRRAPLVFAAAAVLLAVGVLWLVYQGRVQDHTNLIEGCNRGVGRTVDDIAQDDDIAAKVKNPEALARIRARQERNRERIVYCPDEYPSPSIWPLEG